MLDFVPNIWHDLRPIIVHFALAGLFLSFASIRKAPVIVSKR